MKQKRISAFFLLSLLVTVCLLHAPAAFAAEVHTADISVYTDIALSNMKKDLSGGTKYIADYGTITRSKLIQELQAHEHDKFYLNTPYHSGDWQSPSGDSSYNGKVGMNCAGFVSYVLRKCGLNAEDVIKTITEARHFDWNSGRPYSILSAASNYYLWADHGDLICYAYSSMEDLLEAGKAAKGDLILYYINQGWLLSGTEDNHLAFFWGNTPSENLVWHQASFEKTGITDQQGNTTNQIIPSPHYTDIDSAKYILIKIDETDYNMPSAPKVTAANHVDAGKITLTWNPVRHASWYEIFRSTDKYSKYYKITPTARTTYSSTSITPGVKYYYKVRAVSADGAVSAFSDIVSCTYKPPTLQVTAVNTAATG